MVHLHQAADQNQSKLEAINQCPQLIESAMSVVAQLLEPPPKPAPVGICFANQLSTAWRDLESVWQVRLQL